MLAISRKPGISKVMNTTSAIEVAKWLIAKAKMENEALTPLKLQKILYYAQGWSLAMRNQPLFSEDILAWKLGPVVREVYNELKDYGAADLRRQDYDATNSVSDPDTIRFLNSIWQSYGRLTPGDLVNRTHLSKPWVATYNNPDKEIIYQEELRDYFGRFTTQQAAA